jgi:hypothetical protein
MEIKKLLEPININDIQQLEEKLRFKLPDAYGSFLLEFNGGFPSPNIFWINEDEKESKLSIFFGIAEGKPTDIYENYLFDGLPEGILPIGRDPGGNFICIGILPANSGEIFFLDHETNDVIPIGKDLPSFLDSLYVTLRG